MVEKSDEEFEPGMMRKLSSFLKDVRFNLSSRQKISKVLHSALKFSNDFKKKLNFV